MHLGEPANKNTKFLVRAFFAILILVFLVAFWKETVGIFQFFWILFKAFLGFGIDGGNADVLRSLEVYFFNCFLGFGGVFLLWLFLISQQALLPVKSLQQIYRTAWHLVLYMLGRHGPAIFIRDGEQIATQEDQKREGHGVLVIDFNSAVVLESRNVTPGLSRVFNQLDLGFLNILSLTESNESPRVCGPGVTFTRPGERIRGVVDLRKQFRMEQNVRCYTREGIELYANVNSIFTIGQNPEPDLLQVTYHGSHRQENLRVANFVAVPGGDGQFLRFTGYQDDLDEPDRREIHHFARVDERTSVFYTYEAPPRHSPVPVFDRDRVFAAVFAQARNREQDILSWTELPTRVASGFYRELLPQINYDELYDIKGNGHFPLPNFRRKLMLEMRNNGILAYRLIFHINNEELVPGRVYPISELVVSETRRLTNSKMLRDRGIKVIASGFGDLFPVSPLVYQQRLDTWRAKWDQERDVTQAERELQAMRIRSRALANAQKDLWFSLNQILCERELSDEVLAMRVLQSLETAAADPKTRELLPGNTIDLLRQITTMILPPEQRAPGSTSQSMLTGGPN